MVVSTGDGLEITVALTKTPLSQLSATFFTPTRTLPHPMRSSNRILRIVSAVPIRTGGKNDKRLGYPGLFSYRKRETMPITSKRIPHQKPLSTTCRQDSD